MEISKNKGWAITTALLISWSCGPDQTEEFITDDAPAVSTSISEINKFPEVINYSGSLEPWEIAFIGGQNGTRIDVIHAEEGDFVKEGQHLATMNATQFHQAQLQVDLTKRELNRLDTLVKIGSVSGQQFDQLQNDLENAESNLANTLENTELRAPFNGVVTDRFFSRGEIFTAGGDRPSILTLMQIHPIKLSIQVAEKYFRQVNEGMEAEVNVSIFPEKVFSGMVFRIIPEIDVASRTFQVEIRIENEDFELKPGMFSRVNIELGETQGVYVPSLAVISQPGTNEKYIYTVNNENVVSRVKVKTGQRHHELIKIEEGLEPGTSYVNEGMQKLVDGMAVRIISPINNP